MKDSFYLSLTSTHWPSPTLLVVLSNVPFDLNSRVVTRQDVSPPAPTLLTAREEKAKDLGA